MNWNILKEHRSTLTYSHQARANKIAGTDKLSQNLAAQKKVGMKGALEQAAEENRRTREIDQLAQERNWS
jgi:predicted FMN-binding regulatory protein PaiB